MEEKEIKVYLACLNDSATTPATLAKQTGIKRTTVYFYLEKLAQKGLIGCTIKRKRKYYHIVSPTTAFETFFDQKEGELTEQKKDAGKVAPQAHPKE